MPWWGNLIAGLVVVIGLVGIIVPILPGVILIFGAILVWAIVEGSAAAWSVFAICTVFLLISGVIKYTWPGRKMKTAGIPNSSIRVGGILAIVGFFLIPIVGILIGFVLGLYLWELRRLRTHDRAWPSTVHALKAVGLSILIELFGALLASGLWLIAVFAI